MMQPEKLIYKCEICKDEWIVWDESLNACRFCECREKRILEKRLEFAKIPGIYADAYFETFDLTRYSKSITDKLTGKTHFDIANWAFKIASRYVETYQEQKQKGIGLYIYHSMTGDGKSRLGATILNELIKKHSIQCAYIGTKQLFDEILKAMYERDKSEFSKSELIDAVKNAELILLDDIAAENPKDFVKQELYGILEHRINNLKPTIFTSNCSTDELPHGQRVTSRIKGMTVPIYLAGEDYRVKKC